MTTLNKRPARVNLVYLAVTGFLLLVFPLQMKALFEVPDGVPVYMGRMMGALVLALAGVQAFGMQQDSGPLLRRFGIIQGVVGMMFAGILLVENAPAPFWSMVIVNIALGLWITASCRTG